MSPTAAATVAGRIVGVSDASREATASAEQTQAAAERLTATAGRLEAVVSRFRIGDRAVPGGLAGRPAV